MLLIIEYTIIIINQLEPIFLYHHIVTQILLLLYHYLLKNVFTTNYYYLINIYIFILLFSVTNLKTEILKTGVIFSYFS